MENNQNTNSTSHSTAHTATESHATKHEPKVEMHPDNRWVTRFEEILTVKSLEDLKHELSKLAGEIQKEIQGFDIESHLSPSAKERVKSLEAQYNTILRNISKAQKQFDREFNKTLRTMKQTRQEAQKHIRDMQTRINKHRGDIVKATKGIQSKLTATAKRTRKSVTKKTTAKRTKKSAAKKA